jgi:hypothetical protein
VPDPVDVKYAAAMPAVPRTTTATTATAAIRFLVLDNMFIVILMLLFVYFLMGKLMFRLWTFRWFEVACPCFRVRVPGESSNRKPARCEHLSVSRASSPTEGH